MHGERRRGGDACRPVIIMQLVPNAPSCSTVWATSFEHKLGSEIERLSINVENIGSARPRNFAAILIASSIAGRFVTSANFKAQLMRIRLLKRVTRAWIASTTSREHAKLIAIKMHECPNDICKIRDGRCNRKTEG